MKHEMRAVKEDKLVELMRVLAEPPGFGAAPPQRTLVFCRANPNPNPDPHPNPNPNP